MDRHHATVLSVTAGLAFATTAGFGLGWVTGQLSATPEPAPVTAPLSDVDAAYRLTDSVLVGPQGEVYLPADVTAGWDYDGRTYYPIEQRAN